MLENGLSFYSFPSKSVESYGQNDLIIGVQCISGPVCNKQAPGDDGGYPMLRKAAVET